MTTEERRSLEKALLEKTRDLLRYAEERNAIPAGGFLSVSAWTDHISVSIFSNPDAKADGEVSWTLMAWADPRKEEMEVSR